VTLDVGPRFGEQCFQNGSRRFLVESVFRWGGNGTERLLQEGHADALGPAHLLQRGRRPRFALHHLGKQGESDADDFAFLGQAGHGLIQEFLLVLALAAEVLGEFAEGPPKCRQHFSGVVCVEQIDSGGIVGF
jgi:hypothetical protein